MSSALAPTSLEDLSERLVDADVDTDLDFSVCETSFKEQQIDWDTLIEPPSDMTLTEWCEKNISIPSGNAAPGPYRVAKTPYFEEPMNLVTDPDCYYLNLCLASQLGKTQLDLNVMAYHIAHDPQNVIFMSPTVEDINKFNETKLVPLIEGNDVLKNRVAKKRSVNGKNTKSLKTYPGGALVMAWSNSTNSMRGVSCPIVITDEADEYPLTEQGHPCNILWRRASTFDNKFQIDTCTPTTDEGYIWTALKGTDHREYWIPCPHCEKELLLVFDGIKFQRDERGEVIGEPYYECRNCGCAITDADKIRMIAKGRWIALHPFHGRAGFHLNALYSPFVTFLDVARDYVKGKISGDLASFTNTVLALPIKAADGIEVDWERLYHLREDFPESVVPPKALILTATVDVQKNRLELEIKAWAEDKQSWSIGYRILEGDPSDRADRCWKELSELMSEEFPHSVYPISLQISELMIDASYLDMDVAYWVRKHKGSGRVTAIRGRAQLDLILNSPSKSDLSGKGKVLKRGVMFWRVGTNKAKTEVYRRLNLSPSTKGKGFPAGYMHFPLTYTDDWFKGITAEVCIKSKTSGGNIVEKWETLKGRERNEPLDLGGYHLAAFIKCGADRWGPEKWETLRQSYINAALITEKAPVAVAKSVATDEFNRPKKKKKSSYHDRFRKR